jgi:hypothetical protein
MDRGGELDSAGLGLGTLADFCEHCNKPIEYECQWRVNNV